MQNMFWLMLCLISYSGVTGRQGALLVGQADALPFSSGSLNHLGFRVSSIISSTSLPHHSLSSAQDSTHLFKAVTLPITECIPTVLLQDCIVMQDRPCSGSEYTNQSIIGHSRLEILNCRRPRSKRPSPFTSGHVQMWRKKAICQEE